MGGGGEGGRSSSTLKGQRVSVKRVPPRFRPQNEETRRKQRDVRKEIESMFQMRYTLVLREVFSSVKVPLFLLHYGLAGNLVRGRKHTSFSDAFVEFFLKRCCYVKRLKRCFLIEAVYPTEIPQSRLQNNRSEPSPAMKELISAQFFEAMYSNQEMPFAGAGRLRRVYQQLREYIQKREERRQLKLNGNPLPPRERPLIAQSDGTIPQNPLLMTAVGMGMGTSGGAGMPYGDRRDEMMEAVPVAEGVSPDRVHLLLSVQGTHSAAGDGGQQMISTPFGEGEGQEEEDTSELVASAEFGSIKEES